MSNDNLLIIIVLILTCRWWLPYVFMAVIATAAGIGAICIGAFLLLLMILEPVEMFIRRTYRKTFRQEPKFRRRTPV